MPSGRTLVEGAALQTRELHGRCNRGSRKTGRVRTYRLAPQPLKAAEHWMARQRAIWERRLDQLDNYLKELKEPKR